MAGTPSLRLSYLVGFALATGGGIALRLDRLGSQHGVDYVVWQKPYRYVALGVDVVVAADVAPCGAALRARLGAPAYEDQWLDVYRVPVDHADAGR